jgi:hypothetical protein
MEAVRTSETSVDNYFTRQYIPEDNSAHHTRRRENLKSHIFPTGKMKYFANPLKPNGNYPASCTSAFCPQNVFMGFIQSSETAPIISLSSINEMIFVMETYRFFLAVRS